MNGLEKWFAIFRAGAFNDSDGRAHFFTAADLDGLVDHYDGHSPCVITHDELYSPFAWARIEEIKNDDGVLMGRCAPDSIDPKFAKLVKDGRLYNRSVQLFRRPGGGYRLGHVAFLGAEPPAVEGLEPIKMSAGGYVFTAAEEWDKVHDARREARLWEILRAIANKVFGEGTRENPVQDFDVNDAQRALGATQERARQKTETETGGMSMYSQQQLDQARAEAAATARAEAEAAARKELEAERAEFAATRAKARRDAAQARVDKLVDAGQLLPAQAQGVAEFAASLDEAPAFEFSAGDKGAEKTESAQPAEFLFALLEKLPKQISLNAPTGDQDVLPAGGEAGEGGMAAATDLHQRGLKYQAERKKNGFEISIDQAVREVADQLGVAGN